MKFNKKYGYEVRSPFNITSKEYKTNNGYALQIVLENVVISPLLIEQVEFIPQKDFEVLPLNLPEE